MLRLIRRERPSLAMTLLTGVAVAFGAAGCESDQPNDPSGALSVAGVVREQGSNANIAGATVTIQGRTATTSASGQYSVTGLTAGTNVELRVTHQGHQNVTQNVMIDGEETVNITMVVPTIMGYVGNWTGNWRNNTFSTTGSAAMTFNANTVAQTTDGTLDLGGNVFGLGDPPAQAFSGPYTTGSATFTANLLGATLSLTALANGQLSGAATGAGLAAFGISRMDVSGTTSPTLITANYTITFLNGSTAVGTVTLNK